MTFEDLQNKNKHLNLYNVQDDEFLEFGRMIRKIDFTPLERYMETTGIPAEGNVYVRSVREMEGTTVKNIVQTAIYGDMPIQIGYCNGRNSTLNGLEYHKSSEINLAVTDFVLLLGKVQDIENSRINVEKVKAFYVPKGTAIEMYATTLHFAPCKVSEQGFKCVVILPEGTNSPINLGDESRRDEDRLLFMRNKWLLAHPERKPLIEQGAFPGIIGDNLAVQWE